MFRHVIDAIVESKKLLIGHNLFTDLLHICHKFYTDTLPTTLEAAKEMIYKYFPRYWFISEI